LKKLKKRRNGRNGEIGKMTVAKWQRQWVAVVESMWYRCKIVGLVGVKMRFVAIVAVLSELYAISLI
jgi:hypothetical protein